MLGYSDSGKDAGRLAGEIVVCCITSVALDSINEPTPQHKHGTAAGSLQCLTSDTLLLVRSCMGALQVPGGACPGASADTGPCFCIMRQLRGLHHGTVQATWRLRPALPAMPVALHPSVLCSPLWYQTCRRNQE